MSCTGEWAEGSSLSQPRVFEHTGAYQSQLLCSTCPENKSGEKNVIESFHSLLYKEAASLNIPSSVSNREFMPECHLLSHP